MCIRDSYYIQYVTFCARTRFFGNIRFLTNFQKRIFLGKKLFCLYTYKAVSYTHLDVYKRQDASLYANIKFQYICVCTTFELMFRHL